MGLGNAGKRSSGLIIASVIILSACGAGSPSTAPKPTPTFTGTVTPSPTPTPAPAPAPTPAPAPPPTAAARNYILYIVPGQWTMNPLIHSDGTSGGGTTLNVVGYSDTASATKMPGPTLTGNAGNSFSITVVNNDTKNHNFVIQGLTTDTAPIAPQGGQKTYTFTPNNAGTYLYSDTLNDHINRELGLFGMLWIGPTDGSNKVWDAGPSYDFQRLWVLNDLDNKNWNDVVASGGTVDTAVYKPNYFLMNGQGGYDSMRNANTRLEGVLGQICLVRIANAGQFPESLHFHGNHVQVVALNGLPQHAPYKLLDVINVSPLSTVDVLYTLSQRGDYPMHNHTAQMETANGVYLNGVSTMIHVQ